MQFYLILSHFNSSFVFILASRLSAGTQPCRHYGTRCEEGVNTYNNNNNQGHREGRRWFFFLIPAPSANKIHRCQTPDIVVVLIVLELVVVAMAIVGLSTLAYLANLFLDFFLSLNIVPSANSNLPPAHCALQFQPLP